MGIRAVKILLCSENGQETEQSLSAGTYTIGRSVSSDFPLMDVGLSRTHCKFDVSESGVLLTDLGSVNGTCTGDQRLEAFQPITLENGQIFTVGGYRVRITWQVEEEEENPEASPVSEPPEVGSIDESIPDDEQEVIPLEIALHYRRGEEVWQTICLLPGDSILGRSDESDIRLYDPQVSRRHVKITLEPDGKVMLMDLGSANGTQLNGEPLRPRESVPFLPEQRLTVAGYTLCLGNVDELPASQWLPEPVEAGETMVTPAAAGEPVFSLHYRQGEQSWQNFPLAEGEYVVGRSDEADLQLQSDMVSRQHARIQVCGRRVWVVDLHSRNGVQLLGESLIPGEPREVQVSQEFRINDFTFELIGPVFPELPEPELSPEIVKTLEMAVTGGNNTDQTVIGAAVGLDLAGMDIDSSPAPVNLAGHERVTIGRAADNMIRLEHPLVSRYHAIIERMGTRSRITDLHSANGIFVNGEPVNGQSWLKPGDTIKIGPYLIAFTGNELQATKEQSYVIDVIGLQKWVSKETNLLKDISLSIGQNEFVALVGMSGAGKSTLMDAINGFRPGTDGRIFVNGTDLYQNYNQFRDEIGNVPQRDIVHMELTAEQALTYAAELRMPPDASEKERDDAVADTLDVLGLTYRKDLPIARLSGGQIKRVSIGVELLTKPRLFFLDEPTSGLDPGTEYEMMKLLRRLADQGRTIMLITHATKNVMFCDKAIILANGGNLAFYGPPEEALQYFDQFRNHRERLEKEMEFDDIYRILEDPERGTPGDWRERYLKSEYAHYTVPQHAAEEPISQEQAEKGSAGARKPVGKRISGFRQFLILSRRYIRCMVQDRVSLILTLSLAPLLGLMNFIWGRTLFDPVVGNAAKTMGVWFAVTVMGILVGYMGSIQELVKEKAIYKRERAVGLKIIPYVSSKIWVGGAMAFYQAFFILLFAILLVQPLVTEPIGYVSMYFTLVLAIFSAFILGLVISAVSENANTAQLIMIGAFVPQLLLAGVLQPLHMIVGGSVISPIVEARWSFENFVNATGMGAPLVNDPCWSDFDREKRNSLTNEQKDVLCTCMGAGLFQNCSQIPGILSVDFYDDEAQSVLAMEKPEQPIAPERLPTPTPRNTPTTLPSPTFQPSPTYLPTPTAWATLTPQPVCMQPNQDHCVAYQDQQQAAGVQMMEYQETRSAQFEDYRSDTEEQFHIYWENVGDQMEAYKIDVHGQIDDFADEERENVDAYAEENMDIFQGYQTEMETYSTDLSYFERSRQEAISSAEAIISILWDDYGIAFRGGVLPRMGYIALITLVQFVALVFLMKRKDTV